MKEISRSVFLGVLLSMPILFFLNDPDQEVNKGEVAFVLFLTIGVVQLASGLFAKKGEKNVKD